MGILPVPPGAKFLPQPPGLQQQEKRDRAPSRALQLSVQDGSALRPSGAHDPGDVYAQLAFVALDANGDGSLGGEELSVLARGLSRVTGQEIRPEHLLQLADRDGDGKISALEWAAATERRGDMNRLQQEANAQLRLAQQEGNGVNAPRKKKRGGFLSPPKPF